MLECLSFNSLTPSLPNLPPPPPPSHSQENSTEEQEQEQEDTPTTSPNISQEYDLAVQAHSYNEIRSMIQIHHIEQQQQQHEHDADDDENSNSNSHHHQVLTQVLQPDPNSIEEALTNAKAGRTLTHICSSYFNHSGTTSHLCLLLCRSVHRARHVYAPLSDFLSVVSDSSSLSQPQCDHAYDLFLQFDTHENPFNFPHFLELRNSFSDLKRHIQNDRRKRRHRIRLLRHAAAGCAVCCVVTTSAAVVTSAMIAVHAVVGFTAVFAAPFCVPRKRKRKEVVRLKQLDVVENGTFVVNDINTIDSLVDRLRTAVEGDKAYVRFALERGRDRHPIQEVLKQLRKTQPILEQLLKDLEQHIYLCFYTINKARRALLREISLHS